ncbi:UDP-N-acetylglucosamine--N-acetylmuramyl- (pentapeptide) pyrophosphoryl-undecaprenol N- acetylglucosamine transferase [Haliangium ochraceum DSM 14365]|uniref:UDP-N-acetylglucosamine--N-acetylmuramyl-(pentapeptide) pyrophosphoryl-undecaprenol N-acetylglucosamine transferase n=1 Tax=Haliangium ochraceum (strain DSM 14365 / JCM 11303 / SMP-2) TaxID=502025 RepID=D0LXM2_HALO1|nr:UDP-N-acetylglucosamine--N-acetylmuramyl- (pentapeptide) pyrophosphoryl-undecaprenol N- acetylglucosamine transferase [Haliangium ochraceum DSM 14365]
MLIAGGGTGGHLFPGVAVAEALRARAPEAEIHFVGTERGIEARVLPELGWPLSFIEVSGLKTVGIGGAVRGLARIPRAMMQSRALLRELAPEVVLGVGGYASGPVVLAARMQGLPTAILEQNSIPGLTNRILGRVVDAVFLSFASSERFFPARRVIASGNPIRQALLRTLGEVAAASPAAPEATGAGSASGADASASGADGAGGASGAGDIVDASEIVRVLVFGGSQGARALNELVPAAAALLAARGLRCSIEHQTGAAELEATQARYAEAGLDARCSAFIRDMATAYRGADIVVARAGATTVAELGIVGRPAVLIPYPYAADNHQELNAEALVEAGAARLHRQAELTPEGLADTLSELITTPVLRAQMAAAMQSLGRPEAADTVAAWCADQADQRAARR